MSFQIEGRIHFIGDQIQKGNFSFRELVLELEDGNYKQYPKFQFAQAKSDQLQRFRVGDSVKVSFNLRGREHQGSYFTTLDGWKIE